MTAEYQIAVVEPKPIAIDRFQIGGFDINQRAEDQALLSLWYRLRDQWLAMSESEATRRSYTAATNQWLAYLADNATPPWAVTAATVRAWQDFLINSGASNSTVNQRLSACSSWYSFVINEVHLVDGIERSAFFDATGRTRANPFKVGNLKRPRVKQYGKARPMAPGTLNQLFAFLQARNDTKTGSRNYALILTHFLTAARGSEICRLRWGDIRESRSQPGTYIFHWTGKGGKEEDTVLPARAYHAIVAHLKIAGRYPGIEDHEYIFVPMTTHGLRNLSSYRDDDDRADKPITGKSVQRVLKTALRNAGIEGHYRIHDLRHSFAHLYHKNINDLEALRRILHHNSIATTGIYVREMEEPVDTHSEKIYQQLGLI